MGRKGNVTCLLPATDYAARQRVIPNYDYLTNNHCRSFFSVIGFVRNIFDMGTCGYGYCLGTGILNSINTICRANALSNIYRIVKKRKLEEKT
jgi:hypothetical protein